MNTLLYLARRARQATSAAELKFILVNETRTLVSYQQSALWEMGHGVSALSGVASIEKNAPFVQWLNQVAKQLNTHADVESHTFCITPSSVSETLRTAWEEWLPAEAVWGPLNFSDNAAGILFARETPWTEAERHLLNEWLEIWLHAWQSFHARSQKRFSVFTWLKGRKRKGYVVLALLVMLIPIRMSVLAPGELVPIQPAVIRSPLEGTVDQFFVSPNAYVTQGEPLFQLEPSLWLSKLHIAEEALATTETEYRQIAQQAVFDARSKTQLAVLQGQIAEKQADVKYLKAQLGRTIVHAPQSGIVLSDDPSEWLGRPVMLGESVMQVADEHQVEVEAWLSPADMMDFPESTKITFYLNASPLSAQQAKLRYIAYEAAERSNGQYAYRLRASLSDEVLPRVGLKGTVRISGHYAPLIYWVMRRPLAWIRPYIGV